MGHRRREEERSFDFERQFLDPLRTLSKQIKNILSFNSFIWYSTFIPIIPGNGLTSFFSDCIQSEVSFKFGLTPRFFCGTFSSFFSLTPFSTKIADFFSLFGFVEILLFSWNSMICSQKCFTVFNLSLLNFDSSFYGILLSWQLEAEYYLLYVTQYDSCYVSLCQTQIP